LDNSRRINTTSKSKWRPSLFPGNRYNEIWFHGYYERFVSR